MQRCSRYANNFPAAGIFWHFFKTIVNVTKKEMKDEHKRICLIGFH